MPIRPANEVSFSPPPRCPVCNVGILAYGRREPLVVVDVGDERRVYCRIHGVDIEPTYPELLAAYNNQRQAERRKALQALEEMNRDEEQGSPR
ncbi:MAG: hypothetical protein ABJE95_39700 [Byssovorax sp.]